MFAGPVASAAEDAATSERLPTIVVTGSYLPRAEREGVSPVAVFGQREIAASGTTTLAEWLQTLPYSNGGSYGESVGVGSANAGRASPSLRGLGATATLILVNGRRVANYALASGEGDLNQIPLASVDRVEILTDGASAIYGSDAVAGVVNVVLKERVQGLEAHATRSIPQHGGGEETRLSLLGGHGDWARDGMNFTFGLEWLQRGELSSAQRNFAATGYRPETGMDNRSSRGNPGSYHVVGDSAWHPAPDCPPDRATSRYCMFDYQSYVDILPASQRLNANARLDIPLAGNRTFYTEALASHSVFTYRISPTYLDGGMTPSGAPFLMPAVSPYNPIGQDIAIRGRLNQLGPRTDEFTVDQGRWLAGLKGAIASWRYNATVGANWSRVVDATPSGFVREADIRAGLAAGKINGIGDTSSADLPLLLAAQRNAPRSARLDGRWLDLRAVSPEDGRVRMAAGGEFRTESLDDFSDAALASGEILSSVATPNVSGSRRIASVYGEWAIAFGATLETQVAARLDHYSDFGSAATGKLGFAWHPAPSWLLRGAAGNAYRAPALHQLHQPETLGSSGVIADPARCRATGSPDDCSAQFQIRNGGNSTLKPEESMHYSLGAVFSPVPPWSLGATLWRLEQHNRIQSLEPGFIAAHQDTLGQMVIRAPRTPAEAALGVPGAIRFFDTRLQNIGEARLAGVDVDTTLRVHSLLWGELTLGGVITYIDSFRATLDGVNFTELAGNFINATPTPRWRAQATLDQTRRSWRNTLRVTWIGDYRDANPDALSGAPRNVASWTRLDWQTAYTGWRKDSELSFGIRNLTDAAPPFSNQAETLAAGWDNLTHDALGRTFYLSAGLRM